MKTIPVAESAIGEEELYHDVLRYINHSDSGARVFMRIPEIIYCRKMLKNIGDNNMIDCGGGDGLVASFISNEFLANTDIDRNALNRSINRKIYRNLINGDISLLPFRDNTVKAIISISVIEHIPNWIDVLKEFFRVLKPNGKLILTTPNYIFWVPNENVVLNKLFPISIRKKYLSRINKRLHHHKLFELSEIKKILLEIGFEDINVSGFGHPFIGDIWMLIRPLEKFLPLPNRLIRTMVKKNSKEISQRDGILW